MSETEVEQADTPKGSDTDTMNGDPVEAVIAMSAKDRNNVVKMIKTLEPVFPEGLSDEEKEIAVLKFREVAGGVEQAYGAAWIAVVSAAAAFIAFLASLILSLSNLEGGIFLIVGGTILLIGACFWITERSRRVARDGATAAAALELLRIRQEVSVTSDSHSRSSQSKVGQKSSSST